MDINQMLCNYLFINRYHMAETVIAARAAIDKDVNWLASILAAHKFLAKSSHGQLFTDFLWLLCTVMAKWSSSDIELLANKA